MISTGKTESFVYESVRRGVLEVREDGSVWRVAVERGSRWRPGTKAYPCKPHRIDGTLSQGYRLVKVMRERRQVTTSAQRLVYFHFYGPIPPGLTVNHKNGDKTDNRPENLELATYAEQVRHAREVLKRGRFDQYGEKNNMAKLNSAAIREIRRRRSAGEPLKSIAADFAVSDRTISKIARGERWSLVK